MFKSNLKNNILKKINLEAILLYLKFGLISIPGTTDFLRKKKIKFTNIYYKKIKKVSYNHLILSLEKQLTDRITFCKKKEKEIVLFLSSGLDSRLLYYVIYNLCKKLNYLNNFFTLTAETSIHKRRYSEYNVLKKIFNTKIHQNKKIVVNYNNWYHETIKSNKINKRPINGLAYISIKKLFEYSYNKFESPLIITGIGDSVFFNSNLKFFKNSKNNNFNLFSPDYIKYTNSNYLNKFFDNLAKIKRNKIKLLKLKEKILKKKKYNFLINQQFFYKGPKVVNEHSSLARFYQCDYYSPYTDKIFYNLVLNLHSKLLFNKKSKTPVREMIKIITSKYPIEGIKLNNPQREILFKDYKKIYNKVISNSILIDLGIVNKKALLKVYNNYLSKFRIGIFNNDIRKISSYDLWKFISLEIFLKEI